MEGAGPAVRHLEIEGRNAGQVVSQGAASQVLLLTKPGEHWTLC